MCQLDTPQQTLDRTMTSLLDVRWASKMFSMQTSDWDVLGMT